jgi:hypothetical protein
MKIKLEFPWAASVAVGEVENHYGVPFVVVESEHKKCVMVADLPDEEAQAMIEAGRAVAADDEGGEAADLPDEEAQAVRRGRKPKGE